MSRPLPFLRLRCPLETTKPVRHELAEERVQLCKSLGTDAVKTPRAFSALAHQSALLEHLQMLRDGRLGDGKARSDAPGAQLTGGKQPHDLASPRLRDGLEDLHGYSLAQPYISKRYSAGTRARPVAAGAAARSEATDLSKLAAVKLSSLDQGRGSGLACDQSSRLQSARGWFDGGRTRGNVRVLVGPAAHRPCARDIVHLESPP